MSKPNWVCTVCGKWSGRRWNMVRHVKTQHDGMGEIVPYNAYVTGLRSGSYTVPEHELFGLLSRLDYNRKSTNEAEKQQNEGSSDTTYFAVVMKELEQRQVKWLADQCDPTLARDDSDMKFRSLLLQLMHYIKSKEEEGISPEDTIDKLVLTAICSLMKKANG